MTSIVDKPITSVTSRSSQASQNSNETIIPPTLPFTQSKIQVLHISGSASTHSLKQLSATAVSNDKYVKLILKHFKKLEIGLNKFNSKYNGIYSSNLLRTILLPFLRSNYLNKILGSTYKSLVSVFLSSILKWWSSILNYLITSTTISSIDRSVYLECISRIMARSEWYGVIDLSYTETYKELLVLTLDYCIRKLAIIKHIPLSISAFIGKVFAYSFFKLSNVSNALLFLLNVKQKVFEDNWVIFKQFKISDDELNKLYEIFPNHLYYLINYKGIKLHHNQKPIINCLLAPQHPVEGIKEPNGIWVSRWLNSDSDVFNSFLRHYFDIIDNLFANSTLSSHHDGILFNLPGLNILLSHIYQITKVSTNRISTNNSKLKYPEFDINELNKKQNQIYYNSMFKIFRTFRDIKFCGNSFTNNLVRFMDLILMNLASQVSIYDFSKNSLLINVIQEFVNYFETIDWQFWLNSVKLMIEKTDHVQIILKNLSFLFNIWNYIPELYDNKLTKQNLVDWLISDDIMEYFLVHYNSIIRNYYCRLLIWRVIGINNFENSTSINISLNIEQKLLKYHKILIEYQQKNQNTYFKPDNPLVNKKFTIGPISNNDDSLYNVEANDEEVLKKTHPYEIFDEAIYSCTSLSTTEVEANDDKRSKSLVDSIGKIFKILTTEKPQGNKKLTANSKSGSLTSLSTLSLTSRSSSPSLLSFNSTPTSITDLSSTSSFSEETDVKPSIYKLPPEVVRPYYKFDLIGDQDSIRDNFLLMNKQHVLKPKYFYDIPQQPKIPTISIFINSDIYNRIYISTDNLLQLPESPKICDARPLMKFKNVDFVNLGKTLFEWNLLVEEFQTYLTHKVENDKYNDLNTLNEATYFKRLIPLLTLDQNKFLNAS